MNKLPREIIGRATLLVLACPLIWAGAECISHAHLITRDAAAHLVTFIGIVLLVLGALTVAAAIVSVESIARFMGPPPKLTLWENPELNVSKRHGNWWQFWN